MAKISFSASILQNDGMNAAYIEFPFDVKEKFGVQGRVKVIALFDKSVTYRGSLVRMGTDCHILGITKEIRKQLNKSFGDILEVEIEPDLEERRVIIPPEVADILNDHPEAASTFEKLSYSHQKEYIGWLASAKKSETRQKRLNEFIAKITYNKVK